MNDERAGPSSDDLVQPDDPGLADRLMREEFARAPTKSTGTAGVRVHQEFAEVDAVPMPASPRSRSHRAGTLAGLGVVGILLAVLVVVAPGGSSSRVAPQTTHDVSETTPTTPTTRPGAPTATVTPTLHCILGPIC
jgi:hypothetical protein